MPSLNKAMVIGHLGQDPEAKYTPSGKAVCNINIASSYKYTNKETGEQIKKTEWHRLVFWGKLAEILCEYCRKGDPIYIEGRLETRKWTDKSNVDHYTTEIIVGQMQMLGGKKERTDRAPAAAPPPEQDFDFEDDIPFVFSGASLLGLLSFMDEIQKMLQMSQSFIA